MYLSYQNNKIVGYTEEPQDLILYNLDKVEYTEDEYVLDGEEYVLNDEAYQEKKAQAERERIAHLSLTKRQVFLGLYQAVGITPDQIKAQITDPAALIEFEYANDYFRGNPLIDMVGATLGFTSEQLDRFFETNDYTYLLPKEEPTIPEEEVVDEPTEEIEEIE